MTHVNPPPRTSALRDSGSIQHDSLTHNGRTTPRWPAWCLIAILVLTGLLYCYRLDVSGYANAYYAAAAQAGSSSWKAFFFGSLDGANIITIDKPPAALWFMALSVRIFGLSSWSILLPQALMGVASVVLLYFTVRRWHGPAAGLLAAAALASTPIAALMFRFDNPDALLTLLVVAAAYATVRAVETTDPRWAYVIGALIGLAFLTKLLQAFLVVPAFAVTYLVATPIAMKARIAHLLRAAATMIIVAGSWLAIVVLTPAANRPWIGSTTTNSIWDLTIGYNGLGRITGNEVAGGTRVAGGSGDVFRMFSPRMLVDSSWLLITAIAAIAIGLWMRRATARTDRNRAGLIMWGTWLVICVVIFSVMSGIFHTYYAMELSPAIAALFGIGASTIWQQRHRRGIVLAGIAAIALTIATAVTTFALNPGFVPWLMWSILTLGVLCLIGWFAVSLLHIPPHDEPPVLRTLAGVTVLVCLAGPAAFSVSTAQSGHAGSTVSAGPNGSGRDINHAFSCAPLVPILNEDSAAYTWVAAAGSARIPEGCQLATGHPAMTIGGFYGKDPAVTLLQFTTFVKDHKVHYYLEYPGKTSMATDPAAQIQAWVRRHYTSRKVGGLNVYDLSSVHIKR